MLIRFNVTNYLSFEKETEFNMLAASLKQHANHKVTVNNINILKSAVIYGANAAGKSNLIKAIEALQRAVKRGKVPSNVRKKKFKLNEYNLELPTCFEIEIVVELTTYSYGVEFDDDIVLSEWLYKTTPSSPKMIFTRERNISKKHSKIQVANEYNKNQKDKLLILLMQENLLSDNELLLSKNDLLKIKEIDYILDWFNNKLTIISPDSKIADLTQGLSQEAFKLFSEKLVKSLNTGIDSFSLEDIDFDTYNNSILKLPPEIIENIKKDLTENKDKKNALVIGIEGRPLSIIKEEGQYFVKSIFTNRMINGKHIPFVLEEESDGTSRIMDFLPVVYNLINDRNRVYIIDEIDRSLHPIISHKIVELIMANIKSGQLIFSTHESSLLDTKLFRTDEIWFAEKDPIEHTTQLYSMHEFKPRLDMNMEKGYLDGRFGAIPFVANLNSLNW